MDLVFEFTICMALLWIASELHLIRKKHTEK